MDSIVISGISGRFPGCDNTEELQKALVEGRDLVSDNHCRWPKDFYGLTNRGGIMNDIENFDNDFFGVPPRQGDGLDPRTRLLMETTLEAIIDAGVHPMDIRGTRTGVFIGMTTSRGNDSVFENKINYTRIGRSMAMTSGMISFWFDLRGPSYALDTACSSSLYAFCQAFRAIKGGECDAAIVCGATIVLDPYDSLEYKTMNILSPTGKCRFLDEDRDGFVKSESVVVTYLQKSKDAKRIYATVKGCGTNTDGFKIEGVTKPSSVMQGKLMEDIYEEFGINPLDITYMEAHGTGTKIGDVEETIAVADILCKDRDDPLLIGSVKTNIGHTEMASGLTSIIKVILTMQHGVIPPILHLDKVGEDLIPVLDGKLKPVTELTPWTSGLIGVNSFGVGGTNAHVVLEPHLKTKPAPVDIFDGRLVLLAGRNEMGVEKFKQLLKENLYSLELIAMMDSLFYRPIRYYNYRGYLILDKEGIIEKSEKVTKDGRQTWFIYSGIGSQWPHMGRDLMHIEYFKQSMQECAQVLSPLNIDLVDIITNGDEEVFKNVIHCFIAIVAVSVCLTDFLKLLGIEPDGMIGHSVGEVCCAYADGVISKREAMLIAHARGVALQTAPSIDGTLAVVGLTAEEANEILPDDVSIACYNCIDNLTISGPIKSVNDIVDKLKAEEKFAEIIKGANMAYHSKHIAKAGDILFELLEKIIVDCKPCSYKWISSSIKYVEPTSIEENTDETEETDEKETEIIHNPEYHRNNLVNSVYFENAMKKIPQDAIVIEISPKGLLQTIIRRNLGTDAKIVGLSSDTAKDNRQHLLSKIGELFLAGQNPNLLNLYDNTKYFPVSRSTPSLAPMVEWERTMKCKVSYYSPEKSFGENVAVDLMDPTMKYLEGHVVDGRIVYPVMGYAFLAWEIFARLHKKPVSEVPVVISSVKIRRMTLLHKDESVIFNVNILTSNGDFEIAEGGQVCCIGNIKILSNPDNRFSILPEIESNDCPLMTREDAYYKLQRIGFQYQNHFQGISECRGSNGRLKWCDYWIPFLDSAIHYTAATSTHKEIYLPESIERILIDPESHMKMVTELENEIPLKYDRVTNVVQCGKVEIRGLQLIQLAEKRSLSKPKLEKCQFIPYNLSPPHNLYDCIHLVIQIVFENMKEFSTFRVLELYDKKIEEQEENKEETESSEKEDKTKEEKGLPEILKTVISEEIFIKTVHDRVENLKDSSKWGEYDLVVIDKDLRNGLLKELNDSFFLLHESDYINEKTLKNLNYAIVSHFYTDVGSFFLIKKKIILPANINLIHIKTNTFDWVEELKESLKTAIETSSRIYLVNQNQETCGILGLYKCLRYEDGGALIRMISLVDKHSEKFSLDKEFYREQLEKDLSVNIYKNSSWGSYKYFNYTRKGMRESENCHVEVVVPGDITQIKMVENFPYSRNQKDAIRVYYAGINFKDILIAGGILRLPGLNKNNFEIGYEFSGRTADGQRVFGIRRDHCFATTIENDTPFLKVPDSWTLEEAASVPIIYFTLYYAFHYKTKMEFGKSILIHSASGGVGLAAIQMALNHKCKIFATVGNEEKKKALLELFPDLDASNIFNSREDSFEVSILRLTNGYGVDYVLNSLVGDLFNASLKCVAPNGNFIEIGKTEFLLNSRIESSLFLKSASLHAIAIDELLTVEKRPLLEEFVVYLQKELEHGRIKPIPKRKVFDVEDITEAFKYFQTTNHVGKILLKVREEEKSSICSPSFKSLKAIPKLFFNPCKSYIIVGGLGGLGIEFAMMLSLKGAKHIFLNSRSPPKHGYQLTFIQTYVSWGTAIYLNHDDCSSLDGAKKLLNEAITVAPVGGIFNMAMVNKDASLFDQTIDNFIDVYKPKGCITENLDILSRKLCPDLDHFVVYSSITCGKGNLGQTNYGYANSTMERIIEKRNDDKLQGLAIQWGPIADVGYFARTSNKEGVGYYVAQPLSSYYLVLQEFLLNSSGILASSLLRDVIQTIQVGDSLLESLMKLFGITNPEKLSDESTLLELGMDSLMGFEVKQYLFREHNVDITVSALRNKTIREIKEIDGKRKNNTL